MFHEKSSRYKSSSLLIQQETFNEAFKLLSTAVGYDEKKRINEAMDFYKRALKALNVALDITYTEEEWKVAKTLHEKMLNYKKSSEDRLQQLYDEQRKMIEQSQKVQCVPKKKGFWDNLVSFIFVDDQPKKVNYQPIQPLANHHQPPVRHHSAYQPKVVKQQQPKYSQTHPVIHQPVTHQPKKQTFQPIINQNPVTMKPNNRTRKPNEQKIINWKEIPELKGIDEKILNNILNEVMDQKPQVHWDDIAGLANAKQSLYEAVVLPALRPELFTGLRSPAKGILLFGPPGNGKTMLGKAVASQCNATFFSISASSIVSKWHGEGEKLVRALFGVARFAQPSVIFIDEIDSVLSSRSDGEHEASRRMKTEFLVQMDGVGGKNEDRVLIMGATNRPFDLDDAILRRFPKRIFIPLPDIEARISLIKHLLKELKYKLTHQELYTLANLTEGYSGSDLMNLCKETALIPIRELGNKILNVKLNEVRPLVFRDFKESLNHVKPTASKAIIEKLEKWNEEFGSF